LVVAAVGCRPLSADPLQPIPISPAILVRVDDHGIALGALVDQSSGHNELHPVRVDLKTNTTQQLPDPGLGTFNAAVTRNAAGLTVGMVSDASSHTRAARWEPAHGDVLESVPDLGGPSSSALAVNTRGVIAGSSTSPTSPSNAHAYTFDPATGHVTDLGTLGGVASTPVGITDDGVVIGWSDTADGSSRGFVYDPAVGSMAPLAAPPAGYTDTTVFATNPSGTLVVGDALNHTTNPAGLTEDAMIEDRRTGEVTMLNPFGGHRADATDVDDRGIVVGIAADTSGSSHGFAYDSQTKRVVDLGTYSGGVLALGISADLHVVGYDLQNTRPQVFTPLATVLRTSPDAPLAPTVSGCDGSVRVGWTAPAFDGNDAITSYVMQRDGSTIATVGAEVSAVLDTVPAGTTARFTVAAINAQGRSTASRATTFTPSAC
jgi:probable HAF family extracellular repeat protein